MGNQASEDELKLMNDIALVIGSYPYSNTRNLDVHHATKELIALIRTEKLKLLAEVREQTTIFKFSEVLNKLEAEL